MLENFYLCGIKHNYENISKIVRYVVICLKISIFVVSNTTFGLILQAISVLWFAWKFLSLWYQTQLIYTLISQRTVVICLKISIFVVSNTTSTNVIRFQSKLWFAWKFLSLWYQTQRICSLSYVSVVVICLKISIFVVSNTTKMGRKRY